MKMSRGFFFVLFCFVLFVCWVVCLFVCLIDCLFVFLALFETTKICLGSTKMDNFYREKSYITPGKNREN